MYSLPFLSDSIRGSPLGPYNTNREPHLKLRCFLDFCCVKQSCVHVIMFLINAYKASQNTSTSFESRTRISIDYFSVLCKGVWGVFQSIGVRVIVVVVVVWFVIMFKTKTQNFKCFYYMMVCSFFSFLLPKRNTCLIRSCQHLALVGNIH